MKTTTPDIHNLLDCVPSNKGNFDALVRLMYKNVVVPFLGAGFSANFGYKGWTDFLKALAEECNVTDSVSSLLDGPIKAYEKAASQVQSKYGSSFKFLLAQLFGDHVYKQMTESAAYTKDLELLPVLFPSLILTTNFDEVIEMLYSKVNMEYILKLTPEAAKDRTAAIRRIANGMPTLIKLHGDVAKEEFVLAEKEYVSAYGYEEVDLSRPMPALLRDVLLSKIVLFLGCSLENDRTMELMDAVRSEGCMSFALLPLPEQTANKDNPWKPNIDCDEFRDRREFLYKRNIIPIWYPYEQRESLKIFLRELYKRTESTSIQSVTLAHQKVNQLLSEGKQLEKEDTAGAYAAYVQAENLIKTNPVAFDYDARIRVIDVIRRFYITYDYIYKRRDILRYMLSVIQKAYTDRSLEYAWWLHGIAYSFERYRYYGLMELFFKKAEWIVSELEKSQSMGDKAVAPIYFHAIGNASRKLNLDDVKAQIYCSFGHNYYLCSNYNNALEWYGKAEGLLTCDLEYETRAYVVNGLSRYYEIKDRNESNSFKRSIETLNNALEMRKHIVKENGELDAAPHLFNTYSNLIRCYIKSDEIEKAMESFYMAEQETDAWHKLPKENESKGRLLEDKGDILKHLADKRNKNSQEMYASAVEAYDASLRVRNSNHCADDIVVANLYKKIGDIELDDTSRTHEAIEYLIQACVIMERKGMSESTDVQNIRNRIKSVLGDAAEIRIATQHKIMEYRYGSPVDNREQELIEYFADVLYIPK